MPRNRLRSPAPFAPMPGNLIVTPLHLTLAWAAITAICLLVGRAQARAAGASLLRLCAVAGISAALVLAPALPALLIGEQLDLGAATRVVLSKAELEQRGIDVPEGTVPIQVDGVPYYGVPVADAGVEPVSVFGTGYSGWCRPVNLVVLLLAVVWLFGAVVRCLRPLHRQINERHGLPVVEDSSVLASVGEIAGRMRVRPPRILALRSTSGALEMNALMGGTVAPVLVATDGVLGRLENKEIAAIVAHEMAHVARHSIWRVLAILAATSTVMVLLSAFLFPTVAIAIGFAAWWTSLKIHGQRDELACDLRAARAVGFAPMARALDKIHAANKLPCSPALQRVIHATQTHPSEAVRLAHLWRHAPDAERSKLAVDQREVARQRRTNRVVLAAVALVFGFAVWAGFEEDLKWLGIAGLAAVVLLPFVFVLLALCKRLLWLRRLGYVTLPWKKPARIAIYVGCIVVAANGIGEPWAWPAWLALAVAVATFAAARRREGRLAWIHHAIRNGELGRALELCDQLPRRARHAPAARVLRATLLAAGRRDREALDELDALVHERPRYWPGQLLRCQILSWREPERALEIAESVDRAVPDHPHPLSYVASCLARLGRFDEADAAARRALELDPDRGALHTLLAGIASRSGDVELAEERIRAAAERDPASIALLVVVARVQLAKGDLASAEAALQDARNAVEKTPMSLLMFDVDALEQRYRDAVAVAS